MGMNIRSKSENLELLRSLLKSASVLPLLRFSLKDIISSVEVCADQVLSCSWGDQPLIVRSCAVNEDSRISSMAGHYQSVLHVVGKDSIIAAMQKVAASLSDSEKNSVFVQPMLNDIKLSGVAFTRDPNTGASYYIINYDDSSGLTDTVTGGGGGNQLKTYCYVKEYNPFEPPATLRQVVTMLRELEQIFDEDALDVEFALTEDSSLFLFQVRPLLISKGIVGRNVELHNVLNNIADKVQKMSAPHPYLKGRTSVFGIMPDWNPAEIIGVRPRNLALSLYKELVTDGIWAYQRDNYGYRNLRSFPLLVSLAGQPYIDVRVDFNSFIPSSLDDVLAEKLVNYYLDKLNQYPELHDKVEFEIIFSCYCFDIRKKLNELQNCGFTESEILNIENHLRSLTNRIINPDSGLWRKDQEKIEELGRRHKVIMSSNLDTISKIYWLLEDCKRYGTLPFAGLARAAFIAMQIMRSLVSEKIIDESDYHSFMVALNTVGSQIKHDVQQLSKQAFIIKYGHLRPGTYDITSLRYDEFPDRYFSWDSPSQADSKPDFSLSLNKLNKINEALKVHNINHDAISLFNFLKIAIEGRESAKFVFTRSLSDALRLFGEFAEQNGISRDDLSFASINTIYMIYSSSSDSAKILSESINCGKQAYNIVNSVILPPVVTSVEDIYSFHFPINLPNYITVKTVVAELVKDCDTKESIAGAIVMIVNADPGYDWIFSLAPAGLITMFGGVNSHMAIRAGELGIPAVIGSGEALYRQWEKAEVLEINCAARYVRVIK